MALSLFSFYIDKNDELYVKEGNVEKSDEKEILPFYAFPTNLEVVPYKACILSLPIEENGKVKDIRIFYDPYTISNDTQVNMIVFTRPVNHSFPLYFYKNRKSRKLLISKSTEIDKKEWIVMVPFPIYVFSETFDKWLCKDGICHPTTADEGSGGDIVSCSRLCINEDQLERISSNKRLWLYIGIVLVLGASGYFVYRRLKR